MRPYSLSYIAQGFSPGDDGFTSHRVGGGTGGYPLYQEGIKGCVASDESEMSDRSDVLSFCPCRGIPGSIVKNGSFISGIYPSFLKSLRKPIESMHRIPPATSARLFF